MKLLNKQENEKVKQAIVEYYELMEKHKETEKVFNDSKTKLSTYISNFMFVNGIAKLHFHAVQGDVFGREPKPLMCKMVKRTSVSFDIDKLEQRLGKERSLDFVDKEYSINDFDGLVKLLKKSGVNPKEFKKYVDVKKTVNIKKLEKLDNLGDLTLAEIKGCYTTTTTSSYIQVSIDSEQEIKE